MKRKSYSPDQIIRLLREAGPLRTGGLTVPESCRKLEISVNTYHRWRKLYGGMNVDQAHRLKALERENIRLRKLVSDLALDNSILKEVAQGKY